MHSNRVVSTKEARKYVLRTFILILFTFLHFIPHFCKDFFFLYLWQLASDEV